MSSVLGGKAPFLHQRPSKTQTGVNGILFFSKKHANLVVVAVYFPVSGKIMPRYSRSLLGFPIWPGGSGLREILSPGIFLADRNGYAGNVV
jgi:hypothetical protein